MTTGSWFVLFKAEKCAHCMKVKPEFERLGQDEEIVEKGIVLATIDVPTNRNTAARFGIKGFPVLLYFHRKKMYKFKGQKVYDVLKTFLLEGVDTMEGISPIPEPMSAMDVFLAELKGAGQELYDGVTGGNGAVGVAIVVCVLVFAGILAALIGMCFWPSSKDKGKKE